MNFCSLSHDTRIRVLPMRHLDHRITDVWMDVVMATGVSGFQLGLGKLTAVRSIHDF